MYVTVSQKNPPRVLATSPFARPAPVELPDPGFMIGDRITHDHYGLGRIRSIQGNDYVTVDFGETLVRFPRLSRSLIKI